MKTLITTMLIMIRTEYDSSIIVIRMVSMFFLTKSRSRPKALIRDLPIFSGLYSIEGISSQAKHMPGLSSHCEIAFVRQLPIFHYRFSIFLIFENWTREAVLIEVSNFPQSVGIFTHPMFIRHSSCIRVLLGVYFGCAACVDTEYHSQPA